MARNARSFIVETQDYPMDFVVGYYETTASSASYEASVTRITHGLGYAPLIFGMYSLDNGTTWMPIGLNDYYTNQADCWGEADSSTIYITFTALASGTKSARIRVWALAPTTADGFINTPTQANVYNLNTRDCDYSKLVAAGKWTAATGSNQIVAHNLGYVPEVLVWVETANGRITPFDPNYSVNHSYVPRQAVDVTTSGLWAYLSTLSFRSSTISAIHYRIYGGQNG